MEITIKGEEVIQRIVESNDEGDNSSGSITVPFEWIGEDVVIIKQ